MAHLDGTRTNTAERVRIPKAADIIAQALREQILRGAVAPGEMLPSETALMGRFGVSRPSLREALRVLEAEGLVTIVRGPHGGAKAQLPDPSLAARQIGLIMQLEGIPVADVWEARILIEPLAAHLLAARQNRDAAVESLTVTFDMTVEFADDPRLYTSLSTKFHEQIVQFCGNQTLALLWDFLDDVLKRTDLDVALHDKSRKTHQKQMTQARRTLIGLIRAGEADEAGRYWERQLELMHKAMVRSGAAGKAVVDVLD